MASLFEMYLMREDMYKLRVNIKAFLHIIPAQTLQTQMHQFLHTSLEIDTSTSYSTTVLLERNSFILQHNIIITIKQLQASVTS